MVGWLVKERIDGGMPWGGRRCWISVLTAAMLVPLVLATPAGATTRTKAARTAACGTAAKGHAKVTASVISLCRGSSLMSAAHCPTGSAGIIVKIGQEHYALRVGHRPARLGRHVARVGAGRGVRGAHHHDERSEHHRVHTGIEIGPGPQQSYSVQPQPAPAHATTPTSAPSRSPTPTARPAPSIPR